MAKGPCMSMSLFGMITEPTMKIDRAIAWFFASRRNQCIVIREVDSYIYVKESNQGTNITPEAFCNDIADALRNVLLKYFESANVVATPKYITEKGSMFTCLITCAAYEDGKWYDGAKAVTLNNKTFEVLEKARHGTGESV